MLLAVLVILLAGGLCLGVAETLKQVNVEFNRMNRELDELREELKRLEQERS